MPYKKISEFKGIAEHIDPAQLGDGIAQQMYNLDVDNPVGALKMRSGYSKKYSETYTSIISAYEYTLENGDVVLIFNDNGTFKYYKDGTYIGSLTPPAGSTISSTFANNYFGWRNSVRITTGTGATNHILWFGITDKDETDSNGLFGNVLGDSGTPEYKLLRNQMIASNGVFGSDVNDVVIIGDDYFISYRNSKYIEKRDSNYHLLERWSVSAADSGSTVCICASANSTLYVGCTSGVYEIDPYTKQYLNSETTITNVLGICQDGTNIFAINSSTVNKITISSFASADTDTTFSSSVTSITCDTTATTGYIYMCDGTVVVQRVKNAIDTTVYSYDLSGVGSIAATYKVQYDSSTVWVLCASASAGYIVDLDSSDISTKNADYSNSDIRAKSFIKIGSSFRAIDSTYGVIKHLDAATLVAPEFIALLVNNSSSSGSISAGVYFYKLAIEDVDGQIYTLSDPVSFYTASSNNTATLRITVTGDRSESDSTYGKFPEFSRVKNIHVFRAYSSSDTSEESEYSLLETVNINDSGWDNDSTHDVYYFDYVDNNSQATLSSTSYQEMSGISDNTKPRFVNGKYFAWVDNQLHLANIYSEELYTSQIIRSPVNAPDAISLYDIYKFYGKGDEIKGITGFYSRSVVFKENECAIFYDGSLEDSFLPGISSDKGYVKVDNVIYYVYSKGIYRLTQSGSQLISDPVRSIVGDTGQASSEATIFYQDDFNRLIISYGSGDYTLVHNLTIGSWTKYNNFYFRGFFKNTDSEYIGFSPTNFQQLFNDSDGDDGLTIGIYWKSGLIPFELDGFDNEITQLQKRLRVNVTAPGTIKIYDPSSTLLKTITLSDISTTNKISTDFLTSLWCEAVIVEISTNATDFLLSQLVFKHNVIGETVNG